MKKVLTMILAMLLTLTATSCSGSGQPGADLFGSAGEQPSVSPVPAPSASPLKVGIIMGTLGDKNFNDMGYAGMIRAEEELGIEFDYVEYTSVIEITPYHRQFAESEEYDLIIGLGSDNVDAIKEVSADYPAQKYSIIDTNLDHPNVSCVYTRWQEQTFLTGVIAGLCSQQELEKNDSTKNIVGIVQGMEGPLLNCGVVGFKAGVAYVNPDCEVLFSLVGSFSDPNKAKEIALSMYNREANFVQHLAGASGLGVFNAAKEANRYCFGVGGNQNYNEPDYIVATSIRNVHEMVFNEVKSLLDGTWTPGVHVSGIAEGAVGYSCEDSNVQLPKEVIDIVEEIKALVVSGKLVPPEKEDELAAWIENNQYQQ